MQYSNAASRYKGEEGTGGRGGAWPQHPYLHTFGQNLVKKASSLVGQRRLDRAFVYASLLVSKPSQVPAAVCTPWAHGYRYPLSLYSHKRQKGSRMGHSANLNQHSLPINSVVLKKIPCIPLRVRSLAVRLLPGAYFIPSKPQCSDGAVRRIITGHA